WSVELRASVRERSRSMKRFIAITALVLGIGFLTHAAFAQRAVPAAAAALPTSPVSQALEQEMKRAFDLLKQKGNPAPYFISYSVRENQSFDMEASRGALRSSARDRSRLLDVDIRVGEYDLDNTHQIRGQRGAN